MQSTSSSCIEVQKSSIHNSGVFARSDIPKRTKIVEYVGEKISKKESTRRANRLVREARKNPEELGAVYIFELDDNWDIDGKVEWNMARLINHSCDPNCETEIEDGKIWIIALRDIKEGEELVYNYGYDVEFYAEHRCCCGSDRCVGYILVESQWDQLRTLVQKEKIKLKKSK